MSTSTEIIKKYSAADIIKFSDDDPLPHSTQAYIEHKNIEAGQYKDIDLSEAELKEIKTVIRAKSVGVFYELPMRCLGDRCSTRNECPLYQMGKAPVNRKCLIEVAFIEHLYHGYTSYFNITPGDWATFSLVNDLITTEVYIRRVLTSIGDPSVRESYYKDEKKLDDIPIQEFQDGVIVTYTDTEFGREWDMRTNPLLDTLEKLTAKKNKILTTLVGTPQEKYKRDAALKQSKKKNIAEELAKIRETINVKIDSDVMADLQKQYE